MKALILAGGKGTRLRPFTFTIAKQLIPVANKPILGYVLDQIASTGIKDIAIVVSPETSQYIKSYVKDGREWNINVSYIMQQPLGLAHAVKVSKDFLGEEDFLMYLGDNLLGANIHGFIEIFKNNSLDSLVLLKEVDNPKAFGVAILDERGRIIRLIEKPKEAPSNLALIGVYFFSSRIFEIIDKLKPSWRGELEITEAIQELINHGCKVKAQIIKSWWLDTGKKDDILSANAIIIDEFIKRDIQAEMSNSKIEGRVKIGKKTKVINSTIRGPCVIGNNCRIENSFIGPYTSIGDNAEIINSGLEYCVIMENSIVKDISRLEESLIGKNVKVLMSKKRTIKLNIGDYSEVEL